jgi:AraC family transcriptional regulator of adaptative response/methylated-DNA-[protein]-cysteine methyltransferase
MKKKTKAEAVRYAVAKSELGWVLAARGEDGVRAILLGGSRRDVEREVRERFGDARAAEADADAELERLAAEAARLVESPWRAEAFEPALDPIGTPFQRRVWQALRDIPAGETTTYAALAARLGLPRSAARAVGTACGANPIAVAIPCHRVLRGDGSLAGYRWGLERKRELIERERSRVSDSGRAA